MQITRRALLIANPGEIGEENYCKGVYVDVKNYQRLLTSAVGGTWAEGEIQYLNRPSVREVREWIERFSIHDYVLVMFTGHGWYSSINRDHILILRKGEEIASLELSKGAKKRTVILDCCQRVHQEALVEKLAHLLSFANSVLGRNPDPVACRQLFLEKIQMASDGIVKLTSCTINEYSADDNTSGGLYNASLIQCVDDWVGTQTNKQNPSDESFSVVAAHECAAANTRRESANTQNPVISKPKTAPYFPMAVFTEG